MPAYTGVVSERAAARVLRCARIAARNLQTAYVQGAGPTVRHAAGQQRGNTTMANQQRKQHSRRRWKALRVAYAEFLGVPSAIILGFVVLAGIFFALDWFGIPLIGISQERIVRYLFGSANATSDLLGTIAGSVITVASITFSLMLLAVQQSATSLTSQVIDQFLRRRINQVIFSFFIGTALYTLIILATVSDAFVPVYSAVLVLLFTFIAFYLILVMFYVTIDQLRAVKIVSAIHDLTLVARGRQRQLVDATRREARRNGPPDCSVTAEVSGYLTEIDITVFANALTESLRERVEIELSLSIGSFVTAGEQMAAIRADDGVDLDELAQVVQDALTVERRRHLDTDPAFGIEQLMNIAWTSSSSSKHNPDPGLAALRSLRSLVGAWASEDAEQEHREQQLPVVYTDNTRLVALEGFESIGVVTSESYQHQTFAEVFYAMALLLDRLPRPLQLRAEAIIMRLLTTLGNQVLTVRLDDALGRTAAALWHNDLPAGAEAVERAHAELGSSIGQLGSHITRVPERGT